MRIGFTGAQGSGKTTLAKLIKQHDDKTVFVPSTARVALQQGYKINTEADPLSQLLTTVSRIAAEYEAVGELIISDRTPLDSLAYTNYQYDHIWSEEEKTQFYMDSSFSLVEQAMRNYDHIFYCPPYFAPTDDGVRSGDTAYQKAIDEYIVGLIQTMLLRVHTVPFSTPLNRLEWFYETIQLTNVTV